MNEICRLAAARSVVSPELDGYAADEERFTADPAKVRRTLQTIPLRGWVGAHDVAMAVVYLASSHLSNHVTGQTLTVSGGMEGHAVRPGGDRPGGGVKRQGDKGGDKEIATSDED